MLEITREICGIFCCWSYRLSLVIQHEIDAHVLDLSLDWRKDAIIGRERKYKEDLKHGTKRINKKLDMPSHRSVININKNTVVIGRKRGGINKEIKTGFKYLYRRIKICIRQDGIKWAKWT